MAATRIAIDVMGGDHGLRACLPAALQTLSRLPKLSLVLVGDRDQVNTELPAPAQFGERLQIIHAEQTVGMTDKPSTALRHKRKSSMRIAVDLLEQREVDAVVSAGNTGALMAISLHALKTYAGIDRPAICSPVPTARRHTYLLDLGANVDCRAAHLHEFALMGSAMAAAMEGSTAPDVALLNIGEEDGKGNEQVKLAAELIEADARLNYTGFIEGDSLYGGGADVVVCDGFVGNVALKICEGTARLIRQKIQAQFTQNWRSRLMGLAAAPVLQRLQDELNPDRYNGAFFLGLRGLVVKSHGNSSAESFAVAIERAYYAAQNHLVEQLASRVAGSVGH